MKESKMKKEWLRILLPIISGVFWVFCNAQNEYSVDYDGGDLIIEAIADYRSGDSQGAISVWFECDAIADNGNMSLVTSSDEGSSNYYFVFTIRDSLLEVSQRNSDLLDRIKGSTRITTGAWYHGILNSDGSDYTLYLNGSSESLTITSGANNGDWFGDINTPVRDNLVIGAFKFNSTAAYFNGKIDEVAIFSSSLTASQRSGLYNNGTPKDVSGMNNLVGYWRTEEGTGTTVSGNVGNEIFDFGAGAQAPSWSTDVAGWDFGSDKQIYKTYKEFKESVK